MAKDIMANVTDIMFSLVVATVGRVQELERFLKSIEGQSYSSFECIIVDQNQDNRLLPLIGKYQNSFRIIHMRSERGLSHARNVGLQFAKGDVVAFPDDDCWYPPNLLKNVRDLFLHHADWDGITGIANSGEGTESIWKWDSHEGFINKVNVWQRGISISVFLKKEAIQEVGCFDEKLGIGSGTKWGSGEETDLLIRSINARFRVYYIPSLVVYHKDQLPDYKEEDLQRSYYYAAGMGYVLRKHNYPIGYLMWIWFKPLANAVRSLVCGDFARSKHFLATFWGRFSGFFYF